MQLEVYNIEGKSTGRKLELPKEVFGAEPNDHLIYLAVKQYRAAQHQGTHKVKSRGEVKGSSKKLHRQKGTGGSRKGNLRNPLYKGGGTVFGPKPHSYTFKMNKKEKDLARISAFSYKAKENKIFILEDSEMEVPKTKSIVSFLQAMNLFDEKSLFLMPEDNFNLFLSTRNLPKVNTSLLSDVSVYELLDSQALILTESAARVFSEEDQKTEDKQEEIV